MDRPLRLMIYDAKPGDGFFQYLLMLSWCIGGAIMKLFGRIDDYRGFSDWNDALKWLTSARPANRIGEIQFWGHGSPGTIWMKGIPFDIINLFQSHTMRPLLDKLKGRLLPNAESLIWLRSCSVLQGRRGHDFSTKLAGVLGCTVAGHTRIVGVTHGGLHTIRPGEKPSWPLNEGEPEGVIPGYLKWGPNTIWFFQAKIPKGW